MATGCLKNKILIKEAEQIKALLAKDHFHHFTDRQCLFTISKTKYRSLKLKIDILETYPLKNDSLIIEITSEYLQKRLIKQLYKGINKIICDNAGKECIYLIVHSLHDIIHHNMLTFAFDEVYKIRKMFKNNEQIELKVHETKGRIDFKMKNDEYFSHFVLNVPDLYPLDAVTFKLKSSSFPDRYQTIYRQQANDICYKLSKGFDISYITNPQKIKRKSDISEIDKGGFNANTAINIRNDLKIMHKMSLFHNELMNKKAVRRKVRVMNKQAKNEEFKEKELKKQMERACVNPDEQQNEPKQSLLVCMEYLIKQFTDLPLVKCPVCKQRAFPKKAQMLKKYEENAKKYVNKDKYPQRTSCGCWFHHKCLAQYLSQPPFGKKCPKCDGVLKHPLFETDVKALERQWAVQQAKERELNDVDEFVSELFD